MKSLGLISQVLTIGLSVAIGLLYIQPTFDEIGQIQTDIGEYKTQREKIEKVNTDLARHVATLASISPSNVERLTTYMPRFVDDIAVMRDLQFIVDQSGMVFKNVGYDGQHDDKARNAEGEVNELAPVAHEFTVVAEGTYSQVKDFLSLLEQNEYPLEIRAAEIKPLEGGFLSVDLVLVTYSYDVVPLDVS